MLPPEDTGKKGRLRKDNRIMLNGMLWIARELTERYGKWQGVYTRFRKWRDTGVLEQIFRDLSADADTENLSIDATSIKVYQSANGAKKGISPRL